VKKLTRREVAKYLDYDSETGVLRWIGLTSPQSRRIKIGEAAGHANTTGHLQIMLHKKMYMAHRLAWLLMTGRWPKDQIDHINGKHADNRWKNLREATQSQNTMNAKKRSAGDRLKGIYFNRTIKKYCAQIRLNGKATHLGVFKTPELAHAAYCEAAKKMFGKFARFE
jgi:hypothetical protein